MGSLSTTGNEDGKGLQVDHLETANMAHQEQHIETDRAPEAMGREQAELPKGYFYSPYFIGSYCVWNLTPFQHALSFLVTDSYLIGHWSRFCVWNWRVCLGSADSDRYQ